MIEAMERAAVLARRAASIVQNLRDFIAPADAEWGSVNISEVVREAAQFIEPGARRNRVDVRLHLAPATPLVDGNFVQLEQVVVNLLSNGLEAMADTGPAQRTLDLETVHKGQEVELRVRDRGIGLPAEAARHMFDTFFTTKKGGLGMGLSICRTILEAHGGRIWATPNSDQGTTFHVALPVRT